MKIHSRRRGQSRGFIESSASIPNLPCRKLYEYPISWTRPTSFWLCSLRAAPWTKESGSICSYEKPKLWTTTVRIAVCCVRCKQAADRQWLTPNHISNSNLSVPRSYLHVQYIHPLLYSFLGVHLNNPACPFQFPALPGYHPQIICMGNNSYYSARAVQASTSHKRFVNWSSGPPCDWWIQVPNPGVSELGGNMDY